MKRFSSLAGWSILVSSIAVDIVFVATWDLKNPGTSLGWVNSMLADIQTSLIAIMLILFILSLVGFLSKMLDDGIGGKCMGITFLSFIVMLLFRIV